MKNLIREVTKDCPSDACRLQFGPMTSTSMASPAIYDKEGDRVDYDPNTITQEVSCQTCSKVWTVTTVMGKTEAHLVQEKS